MRWIIGGTAAIMALLLVAVPSATNAVPCLVAGGVSFVPVALLPDCLQSLATPNLPVVRVEGVEIAPVRPLAKAGNAQLRWDPDTRTIELQWSGETLRMQALGGPSFWRRSDIGQLVGHVPRTTAAKCLRIVDGDTIVLADGRRVRYIGVDTPETKHARKPVEFFGREASLFNQRLVEGKQLTLEFDVERRDRYGRLLAYVYVGEVSVNAELLAQGYAQTLTYPPNVRYVELFTYLQRAARESGRGLWSRREAETHEVPVASGKYIGSRESDVYHLPHCTSAQGISGPNAIWFDSTAAAQRAGYRPCRLCRPAAQ